MKKLNDSQSYMENESAKAPRTQDEFESIFKQGYIDPKLLEYDIDIIRRVGYVPDAVKLLNEGKIVLLNTQVGELSSKLNIRIPFFKVKDVLYINMSRYGKWNRDKTEYSISPSSELSPILQSAYLIYLFLENSDKLLKDPKIVEMITRIYVDFMVQFLKSIGVTVSDASVNDNMSYVRYLTAKFFLFNILERKDNQANTELAYKMSKISTINYTPLEVLLMREEGSGFLDDQYKKYGRLTDFLEAVLETTETSHVDMSNALIFTKIVNLYGEQIYHSIEYLPYLIYFISLVMKNASLVKFRNKIMSMSVLKNMFLKLEQEIFAKSTIR